MNLQKKLIEAELNYAHFNALRTTASNDSSEIRRESHGEFSCLIDPTKPESPYFNRAVLIPRESQSEPNLNDIPDSIRGIELPDSHPSEPVAVANYKPGTRLIYLTASPTAVAKTEHRIERFTPDRVDDFFDLLELSGADFSAEKRKLKQKFYCSDKFRCHVAFSKTGEPTSWATSFLCDDGESIFLANAFTLPEFRQQGFHSALAQARLNEVLALGRKRAFTDVEPASQSLKNCTRLGIQTIAETVIWER